MKKILLFAAALLGLVACNNKEEVAAPLEPGQPCTLSATIDLNQATQSAARKIAPGTISGDDLNMVWNENDQITISNGKEDPQVFTIVNSSIKGSTATFTGTALQDMSSYTVTYGDASVTTIDYIEGTCHPVASGSGADDEITIDSYYPVLKLTLTGAIEVTSIKYYVGSTLTTTLNCGTNLTLTSEAKTIYFPILGEAAANGAKLEFYKNDGKIKEQTLPCAIAQGDFITLPSLDVRGWIKLFASGSFKMEGGKYIHTDDGTLTDVTNNAEVRSYLSECDEGTTLQLVAKFYPENVDATNVTWSSDNEDILTVSSTGLLTKKCGDISTRTDEPKCNITCATSDGSRTSASILAAECLAAGTRIMMADGTTKKVEDIVEGDLLRTFDHEAGCISSAKVCLTYKGESKAAPMNLTFASGKKLAIVGTHDLLFENTRKYVRINRGNVEQYVGKRFYNAEAGKWDALVSFEMGTPVDYYCIYTAKHLNCIAEGLLTCPDDVDHNLNIYELDANLKADAAQLAADVAKYGLFDITQYDPAYAQYKDQIEDLGGKYVYIAIGKGLVPQNYIEQMKSYWRGL